MSGGRTNQRLSPAADLRPPTPRASSNRRADRERRAQLALGVDVIDDPGHPLYEPEFEAHTGSKNRRHIPDGQYSVDALDALSEEDITYQEFNRRRKGLRRVWEPVPVVPIIVDFTEVKGPLFPSLAPRHIPGSQMGDAPTWQEAVALARRKWPGDEGEHLRNQYYWDRMDHGTLPEDFNPYTPRTDRHAAFVERVTLVDDRPRDPETEALMTRRQTRRRAERKLKRGLHLTDEEMEVMFKPFSEWDLEELKLGMPRGPNGRFPARAPAALMRGELKEKIREELERRVRVKLDGLAVDALTTIEDLLANGEIDGRGRPIVPASVKMRASEFVVDHMLGKPVARVETDVSAKLMAVLGEVMVSPDVRLTADGVVATGSLSAGQRGRRLGHDDEALTALYSSSMGERLALESYVDAEIVGETEDED